MQQLKNVFYILLLYILPIGFMCISTPSIAQDFYEQASTLGITGGFGPEIFIGGGGISFADFNNDGIDDLSFATSLGEDVMFYQNKGSHFELVDPPFVSNTDETHQVIWVDYDNDGDKDLFLSTFDAVDRMYENDGSMNFVEITTAIGLPDNETDTYSVNFADLDKDGWLDLYIARYGQDIIGDTNSLYTYNPTTSVYDCITNSSGTSNGFQESLATAFIDFNNDGLLDIYVSNDRLPHPNSLYMNFGNMSFVDVGVPSGTNAGVWAMNAGVADYNMDGFMDIFVTNIGDAIMYENQAGLNFNDVAVATSTTLDRYCWAGNFFDFDNDRDPDLYVSTSSSPYIDNPNAFMVNNNGIDFSEPLYLTGGLGGTDWEPSFSNVYGDIDQNGRFDLAVSKEDGFDFDVWINHEDNSNNFIKIDLVTNQSNTDAFGTVIEMWINGVSTILQKDCGNGYQSQHSSYLILGTGAAQAIDSLVLKWPYATNEDVIMGSDIILNGMNVIEEGVGVIDTYNQNICMTGVHDVVFNPVPSQLYGGRFNLTCASQILSDAKVIFQSEKRVDMEIGFEVEVGAEFTAEINVCGN